jgi:hypothetical protein
MTAHILRIDLSQTAADFESLALEPGVAMLDRTGANYTVLRRWFGDFVAEPAWADGAVQYYLRDMKNGRLASVVCQPATRDDLNGSLKAEVEQLLGRLNRIRPASPHEQSLLRLARTSLATIGNTDDGSSHEGSFIKYREPQDRWHLAWCWGFRRKDHQPAIAAICTNPECKQLFLRTGKAKIRCPGCWGLSAPCGGIRPWLPSRKKLAIGFAAAAALALAAVGLEFARHQEAAHADKTQLAALPGKSPKELPADSANKDAADHADSPKNNPTEQPQHKDAADHDSSLAATSKQGESPIAAAIRDQSAPSGNDKDDHSKSKAETPIAAADRSAPKTSVVPSTEHGHSMPLARSTPLLHSAPVARSAPLIHSSPLVHSTPLVHYPPLVHSTPLVHPTPLVQSTVVAGNRPADVALVPDGTAVVNRGVVGVVPSAVAGGTVVASPVATITSPVAAIASPTAVVSPGATLHAVPSSQLVQAASTPAAIAATNQGANDRDTNEAHAIYEVKLVGIRTESTSPTTFRALIDLGVAQQARYRLIDDQQHPLSDWSDLGPGGVRTLVSSPLPRNANDDYELFVERQMEGHGKLYRAAFKLSTTATQAAPSAPEAQNPVSAANH